MAKRRTATRTISNAGRLRVLEVVTAARKVVGIAPTESSVEPDGIIDLAYDRGIAQIQVQPITVELDVDGEIRRYTPDVKYVRDTGVIGFREFKDSDTPMEPDMVRKLEAARAYFRRDGFEFAVVESKELRRGYRMDNLRALKRYAQWPPTQRVRDLVFGCLRDGARKTLGELRELVGLAGLGSLYRLMWDQEIGVELEAARLCAATSVWGVSA